MISNFFSKQTKRKTMGTTNRSSSSEKNKKDGNPQATGDALKKLK